MATPIAITMDSLFRCLDSFCFTIGTNCTTMELETNQSAVHSAAGVIRNHPNLASYGTNKAWWPVKLRMPTCKLVRCDTSLMGQSKREFLEKAMYGFTCISYALGYLCTLFVARCSQISTQILYIGLSCMRCNTPFISVSLILRILLLLSTRFPW